MKRRHLNNFAKREDVIKKLINELKSLRNNYTTTALGLNYFSYKDDLCQSRSHLASSIILAPIDLLKVWPDQTDYQ